MKKMLEIRLHGRGGQGAVTAAEILALSAFHDGKYAQAFPSFGVERRGAPLQAFCRIAAMPIRLREQIYAPEYIIIQDASLIKTDPAVLVGADKCYGILINGEKKDWPELKNKNIVCVPATKIALEKIGKPFINTPLVGAFAAMSDAVTLDSLRVALAEQFAGKPEIVKANIEAMEAAYAFVKNQ
jgi:pyruvate ferredoxin oxidoreductase gamma subunit